MNGKLTPPIRWPLKSRETSGWMALPREKGTNLASSCKPALDLLQVPVLDTVHGDDRLALSHQLLVHEGSCRLGVLEDEVVELKMRYLHFSTLLFCILFKTEQIRYFLELFDRLKSETF